MGSAADPRASGAGGGLAPTSPIRVGVSSCLLGRNVRYDGGHKHNSYITETLSQYIQLVPFCPEMAIGLGVPRPPIQLRRVVDAVRVVQSDAPDVDLSERLCAYGRSVAAEHASLSGYIFKAGSPSCGTAGVPVHGGDGTPVASGTGMFARAIMDALPLLPVEEEARLIDPALRDNFLERVFILHRWRTRSADGLTPAALVEFHSAHKFSVLAHDEQSYRELGRLVATAGQSDVRDVARRYIALLMTALAHLATRKRHTNVLMHALGFLTDALDAGDKAELLEIIDAYRNGRLPLAVPVTLLRHHLRRHPHPYLERQVYLWPDPGESMLRNGV